jgi:hypothetical protein
MKNNFLITCCSFLLLASCSTIYQTGQTPDDVYYSPSTGFNKQSFTNSSEPSEYYNPDDNYLRMAVRNRQRWSRIDDFSYWYDTRYTYTNCYNSKINYGWNSYYSNFNNCNCNNNFYWGNNYNYWGNGWQNWNNGFYVINYKNPVIYKGTLSTSNITAYRNKNFSNNNNTYYNPKTNNSSTTTNNNSSNLSRKVNSSNNNGNSGSTWERPVRTNTSPTPPSSTSGGNSGGFKSTGTSTSTGRGGRN